MTIARRKTMRLSITTVLLVAWVVATGLGCSKYKQVGPPDFALEIKMERQSTISPGKSETTYTVTSLTINGHDIELAESVTSSESPFYVESVEYGPMQFKMEGEGFQGYLSLHLTKDQQEAIRALGTE